MFPRLYLIRCLKQDSTGKKSVSETQLPLSLYHIAHCCFPMLSSLLTQPLPPPPDSDLAASPCLLPGPFAHQALFSFQLPLSALSPFSPHFKFSYYFCSSHYSNALCSGFPLLFPTPGFAGFLLQYLLLQIFVAMSFPPLLSPHS